MQFLKTLFWVILAILMVLFALANWTQVTVKLWGGLLADVKLPVLLLAAFLIGFLPTFIIYRGRLWALKRRIDSAPPVTVANKPGVAPAAPAPARAPEDRIATDSKIWPA